MEVRVSDPGGREGKGTVGDVCASWTSVSSFPGSVCSLSHSPDKNEAAAIFIEGPKLKMG